MDGVPPPDSESRSPINAIRTSLTNGIQRYRRLKDAPESRRLIFGFLISWIASRMNLVALVVLSYQIGDGALGVGGMMAMTLLPGAAFQPIGGMLVDKFPGKRPLVIVYLLLALVALSYLLLIPFASIWLLYVIRFLSGTIQAVEMTAFEVRLMMLTPSDKRGTANAVQAMGFEVGEIIGPLLGGALLAMSGVAPIFIVNTLALLFLSFTVWRLPDSVPGAQRVVEEDDVAGAEEAAAAASGGYRWLLKRPEVIIYLFLAFGSGLLSYGLITAFVSKALDIGLNEGSVGTFFSVIGVGALIGGMFAGMGEYASRRALIITGLASTSCAISVVLFGYSDSLFWVLLTLFAYGLIINIEDIPALTYFQNRLPESVYGRFFSGYMSVGVLGGFFGSILVPVLIERYSVATAFTILAIPGLITGIVFAARAGGLRSTRPFPPPVIEIVQEEIAEAIETMETELLPDADALVEPEFPDR